jgi:hypothetical protein
MDHKLLPQSWLYGFLYTYATTRNRESFLLGATNRSGWWYYFPLAVLFKTPVVTLLLAFGVGGVALAKWLARQRTIDESDHTPGVADAWTAACLIIPPGVILLSAMTSNVDIGLRHVLAIYPFLYIGVGVAIARFWPRIAGWHAVAAGVLAFGLTAETALAYPDYLPFFNVVARHLPGARDGLHLLGDSNLDWGQDLPLLAQWAAEHRDQPLFLSYFGMADPQAYGIRYQNLPSGYRWGPPPGVLDHPGYIAVSATNLQGMYNGDLYKPIREDQPLPPNYPPARLITILGGSIYVYDWTW